MAANITYITSPQQHDKVVEASKTTPTVICVSHPVTPVSKEFTKKYEELAARFTSEEASSVSVKFCLMEFSTETSMLYKFSPNQLPVVALMCYDRWARTIMGANIGEVEATVGLMLEQRRV